MGVGGLGIKGEVKAGKCLRLNHLLRSWRLGSWLDSIYSEKDQKERRR